MSDRHWTVPREWAGERCFIICGGESVKAQRQVLPRLKGRTIAIKQAVKLRPDADVMFVSGRDDPEVCKPFFPLHTGKWIICRSAYPGFPNGVRFLRRPKDHDHLARDPGLLAGLDAGSSAINLAFHFGAAEIVLLGFDMRGGRWLNGEIPHHMPFPPQEHFDRHMASVAVMARDLAAEGVKVWNASPISAVTCFETRALETFL